MDEFIRELNSYIGKLPTQTIKTIRGQAKAGNLEAARVGFNRVKRRLENNGGNNKNCSSQFKKR